MTHHDVKQSPATSVLRHVERRHYQEHVEDRFRSNSMVVLQGDAGVGKTQFLHSFAERHSENSVYYEMSATSLLPLHSSYAVAELINQLVELLPNVDQLAPSDYTQAMLFSLYPQVMRALNKRSLPLYFVIDGLHHVPSSDTHLLESFLALLPRGNRACRFLLSDSCPSNHDLQKLLAASAWSLPRFSPSESLHALSELAIEEAEREQLARLCNGNPAFLASCARLILAGTNAKQICNEAPKLLADLLDLEWKRAALEDDTTRTLLALVAYARADMTCADASVRLGVPLRDLSVALSNCSLLTETEHGALVRFTSTVMHEYARGKLEPYRAEAIGSHVSALLNAASSADSVALVPRYYRDAGDNSELLQYLSPTTIKDAMASVDSLTTVRESLSLGLESALELNRDDELFRLSLHSSSFVATVDSSLAQNELQALTSMGFVEDAIALAEGSSFHEDRIFLLAAVGHQITKDGNEVPGRLEERLRSLCEERAGRIPWSRAVEIAPLVFPFLPDLAVTLLDAAAPAGSTSASMDSALATLSLRAVLDPVSEQSLGPLLERIDDEDVRSFVETASAVLGDQSAEEILRLAAKQESPVDELFLLKAWCHRNRERDGAGLVAGRALDLAIATTEYAMSARDALQLAQPLLFLTDADRTRSLFRKFDSVAAQLEIRGPTAAYSRLRTLMAQSSYKLGLDCARERFEDGYLQVTEITDPSVRANCLARLQTGLESCSAARDESWLAELAGLVNADLGNAVSEVLCTAASHAMLLSPVVSALAKRNPARAASIIESVNTPERRDSLRTTVIRASARSGEARWSDTSQILDTIESSEAKDRAVVDTVSALARSSRSDAARKDWSIEIGRRVLLIEDPERRARGCALALRLIKRADIVDAALDARLWESIQRSLDEIDSAWNQVQCSFFLVPILAGDFNERAKSLLSMGRTLREQRLRNSNADAWLYVAPLQLALASFAGLLRQRQESKSDFDRVRDLIAAVPSLVARAEYLSALSVYCYVSGRHEYSRQIADRDVELVHRQITKSGSFEHGRFLIASAEALFFGAESTALRMFREAAPDVRESAVMDIVDAIVRKVPAYEPWSQARESRHKATYNEVNQLLGLASLLCRDQNIWLVFEGIANSVCSRRSECSLTKEQRHSSADTMEQLISEKLPAPKCIAHDGYAVLCRLAASRVRAGYQKSVSPEILAQARAIPNSSDRCFVLAHLADATRTINPLILEEAEKLARQLPNATERVDRLRVVADFKLRLDKHAGQDLLQSLMRMTHDCEIGDMAAARRAIVDIADQHSPDFASVLCSHFDDDPARLQSRLASSRAALEHHLATHRMRRKLEEEQLSDIASDQQRESLPRAAWSALAHLNSGRCVARRPEELREMVRFAATLPLSEAFPILMWAVGNVRAKYNATREAERFIRPFFESAAAVCEIAGAWSYSTARTLCGEAERDEHSELVGIGERDKGIEFLKNWLAEVAEHHLWICDPYFCARDMWFLQLVQETCGDVSVVILTSKNQSVPKGTSVEDEYRDAWDATSSAGPPETHVVLCDLAGSGRSPVHDRFLFTEGHGLQVGTSLSGLGKKEARIDRLFGSKMGESRKSVSKYLVDRVREVEGQRVRYSTFDLD